MYFIFILRSCVTHFMLIISNSLSIDWSSFFETYSISFNSNSSEILLSRDHNRNKAYNLLLLCNSYHQLSAIKDTGSYSLVFCSWIYIFETVRKIIDGKIYLLTYLTNVEAFKTSKFSKIFFSKVFFSKNHMFTTWNLWKLPKEKLNLYIS